VIALGERYGLLTVVRLETRRKRRYRVWFCRCDCGGRVLVTTSELRRGGVTSCGCRRGSKPGAMGGCRIPLKG